MHLSPARSCNSGDIGAMTDKIRKGPWIGQKTLSRALYIDMENSLLSFVLLRLSGYHTSLMEGSSLSGQGRTSCSVWGRSRLRRGPRSSSPHGQCVGWWCPGAAAPGLACSKNGPHGLLWQVEGLGRVQFQHQGSSQVQDYRPCVPKVLLVQGNCS